ncbi:hypothetical protein FHS89_002146 [Rubricella aquisinus]|uniref:Uncharacterized protein n=1 Tax=Rubricella aquisinus TaxID=2028108 RepID=A0A840WY82_9RHOB|nr:hypothetical protein [Rubricella aquisinus]MBB5516120.1 hypothetical protein [Rubricella aquisinus]
MTRTPARPVLILGSAPDALRARDWPRAAFHAIVVLNTAWQVRPDWTHSVMSNDYAGPRPAPRGRQFLIPDALVAGALERAGGILACGPTMALTAGYWAAEEFAGHPLIWAGCDMLYPDDGPSHFYGRGEADPLRAEPTLRNLPARAARLWWHCLKAGCSVHRLSAVPRSNLPIPRINPEDIGQSSQALPAQQARIHPRIAEAALQHEERMGLSRVARSSTPGPLHVVMSITELDTADALWLRVMGLPPDLHTLRPNRRD